MPVFRIYIAIAHTCITQLCVLHGRSNTDAKEFLAHALPALIGHGWMFRSNLDIITSTMGKLAYFPIVVLRTIFQPFHHRETSSEALSMKVLADMIALVLFSVCTFVSIRNRIRNNLVSVATFLEVLGYSRI